MTLRGTFLGSSITSINCSTGWGTQPSELTVGLVTDPSNGDSFSPVPIGTPVYLSYGSLNFGGLLNTISQTNGPDGNLYQVSVVDPRSILEGVQLITGGYTGGVFGVPNLYNVFGALEFVYGDSGRNESGLEWYKIRNTFHTLHLTTPIRFAGVSYLVDLTRLPVLPNYYRIGENSITLMDFIAEVCDAAAHDYFFKLMLVNGQNVITVFTINRSSQPALGTITTFLQSQTNIVRSDIQLELRNETTSKFLVGGNKTDILFRHFESGAVSDTTDTNIFPYWGTDEFGNAILGSGEITDEHNFVLPSRSVNVVGVGEGYHTNIEEMRAALGGRESWEVLLEAYNADTRSIHFGKANKIGLLTDVRVNSALWERHTMAELEGMTSLDMINFLGRNVRNASDALTSFHEENVSRLYEYVRSFAEDHYGKRYMVMIPSGNVQWDEDTGKLVSSLEPTDAGFIPEILWSGAVQINLMPPDLNFVTLEDGRVGCYVKFDNYQTLDLSELSKDDYVLGNHVGAGSASVFIKASLQEDIQFLNRSTVYSPRVIVELPGRIKPKSGDGAKSDVGLFKKIMLDKLETIKGITNAEALILYHRYMKSFGAEITHLTYEGLAITPKMAAVPLKSNVDFYGPWYVVGAQGKTEFEQDESLVPWNYGGFELMNLAANARVSSAAANFQIGEGGSIELPGIPIIDIGAELITAGPYITDIQVNIGQGGVTTTYRMQTWATRFGKIPKSYIDTIQKIKINQQKDRRIVRELNKLPGPGDKKFISREFHRFIGNPRRRAAHTSSSIIGGEVIISSGDLRKANVVFSPAYNMVNHIDVSGYEYKSINSLDTLFRPFTTDPSGTGWPHFETPTNSGINVTSLNPFSNSDFIIYNKDYPSADVELSESSGYIRGMALRGPLVLAGWGYDLGEDPIPSISGIFIDNYKKRMDQWKVGPVDLRWDDMGKIWVGGSFIQRGVMQQTLNYQQSGIVLDSDTSNTELVYDHLLSAGQSISTGKNVIYALIHNRKYVIGAQC